MRSSTLRSVFALWLVAALTTSCAEIRVFTYPSDFVYLDDEGVQDTMQELSRSVRRLNTLISSGPVEADDKATLAAIDDELYQLQATAGALGVGAGLEVALDDRPTTNHLLIDDHVDEFLADVDRARVQLLADPPNLYAAGTIVGSCTGCHRYR